MSKFVKSCGLVMAFSMVCMIGVAFGATSAPALQDITDQGERARVEKLIEGAKAEGKLEWLGVMIEPAHAKHLAEGFKKYYGLENFEVEYTYSNSSKMVTRVEQLIKARRPTPDIMWGGGWAWFRSLQKRGQVLKYDSPSYKGYTLSHKAGLSVDGYWVSDGYTFSPMYNPKQMAEAGLKDFNPTSWWDFVDPKLKGLLSAGAMSGAVTQAQTGLGMKKVLGMEYFNKLKALEPPVYNKTAQGREWVINGEYPVSMFHHAKNATVAAKSVPIKLVYPKEGVVMVPFAAMILKNGQHTNAAKLFIDYARSENGLNQLVEAGAYLFYGRPGITTKVPDLLPPWEKLNLIDIDMDKDFSEKAIRDWQKTCLEMGM